jgi:hypothetical protein
MLDRLARGDVVTVTRIDRLARSTAFAWCRTKAAPVAGSRARNQVSIVVWEASDRICGKRLRPLLPILVEAMEQHGHLQLVPEVRTSRRGGVATAHKNSGSNTQRFRFLGGASLQLVAGPKLGGSRT